MLHNNLICLLIVSCSLSDWCSCLFWIVKLWQQASVGRLQEHASQGRNQPCAAVISGFVWLLSSTCGGDRIETIDAVIVTWEKSVICTQLFCLNSSELHAFCLVTDAANVPESPSGFYWACLMQDWCQLCGHVPFICVIMYTCLTSHFWAISSQLQWKHWNKWTEREADRERERAGGVEEVWICCVRQDIVPRWFITSPCWIVKGRLMKFRPSEWRD